MFKQKNILDYCPICDKILEDVKIETNHKHEEKEHSEYLKLQKEKTK